MYYQPQIDFRPDQVLAYLRKSQSDDPLLTVEELLAKHETISDEWAQRTLGGVVPEENKFREVVSGETIKGRPEVQKVLRLMESPPHPGHPGGGASASHPWRSGGHWPHDEAAQAHPHSGPHAPQVLRSQR